TQSTFDPYGMHNYDISGSFDKARGTQYPEAVSKTLAQFKAGRSRSKSGIITTDWQGRFSVYSVITYNPKDASGHGVVYNSGGRQIGTLKWDARGPYKNTWTPPFP